MASGRARHFQVCRKSAGALLVGVSSGFPASRAQAKNSVEELFLWDERPCGGPRSLSFAPALLALSRVAWLLGSERGSESPLRLLEGVPLSEELRAEAGPSVKIVHSQI